MNDKNYFVLAYYLFTLIEDPAQEVKNHINFFKNRDVKSRIYISKQGINGQMSASVEAAEEYMSWLKSDPRFAKIEFKIHTHHEHPFPRLCVKLRKQLVALDVPVDISLTGEHLTAQKWEEMIASRDHNTLILDVRNDYEWEIGHFEGAELPTLEQFREFPAYVKRLKEERDLKTTKVMMYCTGGIRCELYSALLKEEGFENVFQLEGGVIKYGLQNGSKQWRGKLFVFDDRMAVALDEKEEVISQCHHCPAPSDVHYNCANMHCNELFTCCPECASKWLGCCSQTCREGSPLRPLDLAERPKPFRRKHLITPRCAFESNQEPV